MAAMSENSSPVPSSSQHAQVVELYVGADAFEVVFQVVLRLVLAPVGGEDARDVRPVAVLGRLRST